jgi:hypothetical protein
MRNYYMKYSRLLVTGNRLVYGPFLVNEQELKDYLLDDSRYKYIVLSAELTEDTEDRYAPKCYLEEA